MEVDMTDAMSAPSPVVVGDALRRARTTVSLTLKQVSEHIGLAVSTISEIEAGKRRITGVELYKFAKLHQRPITFFLEEGETSPSFAILLRAASTTSLSKRTIVDFHELCRDYRTLLELMKAPAMPNPPDYSASKPTALDFAEELAETERTSLGLNGQPIKDTEHSKSEKRYYALGKTDNGRFLFIVFTIRKKQIRIISARDMNKKERQVYINNEKNS